MSSHRGTTLAEAVEAARLRRRDLLRLAAMTGVGGVLALRGLSPARAQDAASGRPGQRDGRQHRAAL